MMIPCLLKRIRFAACTTALMALTAFTATGAGAALPSPFPAFKIGAGSGMGFAGASGVGAELEYYRAALIAAVGKFEGPVWEVGLRYYLMGPGRPVRPHASASYAATHDMEYGYERQERHAVLYGLNLLAGLDQDFGERGAFMATYGLGLAIPGGIPGQVREFYAAQEQKTPAPGTWIGYSLGVKYEF